MDLPGFVSGTDANSINTALAIEPYDLQSSTWFDMQLAYQEYAPQYDEGQIKQTSLSLTYYNGSWGCSQSPSTPSIINDYCPNDYNPSVVIDAWEDPVACWIDNIPNNENGSWAAVDQMTFNVIGSSVFYYYGDGVQSCSISLPDYNFNDSYADGFAAWSQIYNSSWSNQSLFFESGVPKSSDFRTLNTTGKYIQLANGTDTKSISNIYVPSFYPFTAPYSFKTSQDLGSLSIFFKQTPGSIAVSRGCNINKGSANFTYRFGDLNVDGQDIDFIDAPDTLNYRDINRIDSVLETQPFQIGANSKVVFTERSGFSDSASAVQVLGVNGFVGYKVEMIDNATNKVIGTVRNVTMTASSLEPFKLVAYNLNTNGIHNRTVKVRISASTNLDSANVALAKSYAPENLATGAITQSLSLQSVDVITTYALAQNYPNPFNPSTMINYQLPIDGHVTLKVYDVLGREVKTLVDESKSAGSYEVKFEASSLASGIYFYRVSITGNDGKNFVSTKKMLLMK